MPGLPPRHRLAKLLACKSYRGHTRAFLSWANGCNRSLAIAARGVEIIQLILSAELYSLYQVNILVANLGSTSLKWRLFDFSGSQERLLHKGDFERVFDYPKAIGDCLAQLKDGGHIQSEDDLAAVGFKTIMARGVNGCVRLDEDVVKAMEAFNGIAPAHNPPYITGIRLFAQRIPQVPLVGLFETAFYQWVPQAAVRYAVPDAWHNLGVRRWGFHGASHKFIAERSAELLGRDDVAERVRTLYVNDGATSVQK